MDKRKSTENQTKELLQQQAKRFSARFSKTPQRLSSMHEKFKNVRLKNYKEKNLTYTKNIFLILLLLALFIIFFFFSFSSKEKKKQIIFCDSDNYNFEEDKKKNCVECPNNALCKNRKIIECYGNYIIQDQKCVLNEELILLKNKMLEKLENILARKNGEKICSGKKNNFIKFENFEKTLKPFFGGKNMFVDTVEELKNDLEFDENFSKEIKTKYLNNNYSEIIAYTDNVDFSFFCQMKNFYRKKKFAIFCFFFVFVYLLFFTVKKIMRKKFVLIAEKIYKEVLNQFRTVDKIDVRNLVKDPNFDFTKKERDAIFEELENIRVIDEQITYYVANGVKYWVPL